MNMREDQFLIAAGVVGVNLPPVYSWSSLSGGDVEAEDTKARPGGMLPQQSLGGPTTRNDVTVERNYNPALHPYVVQLENVAGRATMWVSYTPLDNNGNPAGGTTVINGTLKGVKAPDRNANSTTTAAYLSLTMSAQVASTTSQ